MIVSIVKRKIMIISIVKRKIMIIIVIIYSKMHGRVLGELGLSVYVPDIVNTRDA